MLPPRRILVAVDFSPGSQAAQAFAGRLTRHCGAELHLVHAADPLASLDAAHADTRRRDLHQGLRQTHTALAPTRAAPLQADPALTANTSLIHVVEGEPGDVIVHVAARERADLIVLGTHGSHVVNRTLGTTVTKVLERATVPVLAVPDTWTPPSPDGDDLQGVGPVIAALNVTCPAIEGASGACGLAEVLKTRVILVHAVAPTGTSDTEHVPEATPGAAPAVTETRRPRPPDTATQDVEVLADALRARCSVPVEMVTETGDVCDLLAAAAQRHVRGLIVLGRGVGPHAYGPPCSIAKRLLNSSRVPVLVHASQ